MVDVSALAALIVAAVALVVALAQLTQQLLATAYVIRKCDRIVTGGLTKGGTRQWHWRQFRFTVNYQAVVFALPPSVYQNLGISSTIQVNPPSKEIWNRALKTRSHRNSSQACWISLLQDLAQSSCLSESDVCIREESGDRIPEDLTVAPGRVDCMTVLLSCIAMGMQVFKYSPTTGEVTLGGGVGSISSSIHPVLGGLLHYSVFADEPTIGLEAVQRHGRALVGKEGIWANAVFGRFRDRLYRPEMVTLRELQARKIKILRHQGWPEDKDGVTNNDTIGGAACFMAFGHVDACDTVPPSVVRPWSAHFAETIVKAHHVNSMKRLSEGASVFHVPDTQHRQFEKTGFSSPHDYMPLSTNVEPITAETLRELDEDSLLLPLDFSSQTQLSTKWEWTLEHDRQDPSSYCPPAMLWGFLRMMDCHLCVLMSFLVNAGLQEKIPSRQFHDWVDRFVAKAISKLFDVGAPSFGKASDFVMNWPQSILASCADTLPNLEKNLLPSLRCEASIFRRVIRLYAELCILRPAYYTVMMRAAHPIGPGLTEESSIETALAYMA